MKKIICILAEVCLIGRGHLFVFWDCPDLNDMYISDVQDCTDCMSEKIIKLTELESFMVNHESLGVTLCFPNEDIKILFPEGSDMSIVEIMICHETKSSAGNDLT